MRIHKYKGCLVAASERANIPCGSKRTWTPFHHPQLKQAIEQLENLLKKISKTVGILTQQSKWPLQGNGIAAITKNQF